MGIFRKIPLHTAWYSLIILASMLPAVVLSPWLYQKAHTLLLDRAMLSEKLFHQTIETHLQLETERLVSVLQNKSDPIAYYMSQHTNMDFMYKLLAKINQRESLLNTTSIYDQNANIILSTHHKVHMPAEINRTSPAFAIPMHGRVFISPPIRLPDRQLEFLIAVPLINDNDSIGVMISTVNIDTFWQNIRAKIPEHLSNTYLIDGRGSLLTTLPDSEYKKGALLSDREMVRALLTGNDWLKTDVYKGLNSKEVFGIGTLVHNLQWGIISEIPSDSIISPITSILITLTLIIVILHALFGLISLIFTKQLLHPVSELAAVVKRAAYGNYEHRLNRSRYREIDDLTTSFSMMIHEIEKREHSLEKLSQVVEQAGEAILITDESGMVEYVNTAFTRVNGYRAKEVIGKAPSILKSGNQTELFYKNMWETILSGKVWQGKLIDRKKDGTLYPVMMTISPIMNGEGELTHFAATYSDLTEYDEMQTKFEQAQKMEAIGTLVAGIAHNFNNILAGISGNLYLLRSKIKGTPETDEKMQRMDSLVHHAAEMVSELMIFARKSVVEKKDVNLTVFIKAAYKLAAISLPGNIKAVQEFTNDPLYIHADTNQIQQAMMNVLNNAHDAVVDVEKPEIRICLERFEADSTFIKKYQGLAGKAFKKGQSFARLSISDNGCGISKEHLTDIFQPFFTTKEVGVGTGLGLAMSYGTIQDHGGELEVESEAGQGTTFSIYLPLLQRQSNIEEVADKGPVTLGNGETILLADDDEQVRATTAKVLEDIGYKVLQAKDGREAIDIFKMNQENICLLILDVVMPHASGIQITKRIREEVPNIPVIFITGYDNEQVLNSSDQPLNSKVFSKPIEFTALSHGIRQMLDG